MRSKGILRHCSTSNTSIPFPSTSPPSLTQTCLPRTRRHLARARVLLPALKTLPSCGRSPLRPRSLRKMRRWLPLSHLLHLWMPLLLSFPPWPFSRPALPLTCLTLLLPPLALSLKSQPGPAQTWRSTPVLCLVTNSLQLWTSLTPPKVSPFLFFFYYL